MALFKNKYRIESARLRSWDYSSNAAYFVTICTSERYEHFGQIIDDQMHLSSLGVVADNCWVSIPYHFPFVILGAHVIMPNHVHGIITIDNVNQPQTLNQASATNATSMSATIDANVETQNIASLPRHATNRYGPQSKNLASIVRGFKIGVTNYANQNQIGFKWQPRFHDHIIRNEQEYEKIHNYIIANPENWKKDKFYNPPTQ